MACTTVTWTRKILIEYGHTAGARPCICSLTRTIVLFWFILSAQRMYFAWVKKFAHFVVTSNSPHSVLTDVFGIITTKRFLFVWPVSSEVVNTARNHKLDTTGYVKFRKVKLTRDTYSPGILSLKIGQPVTNCNRRFFNAFWSRNMSSTTYQKSLKIWAGEGD